MVLLDGFLTLLIGLLVGLPLWSPALHAAPCQYASHLLPSSALPDLAYQGRHHGTIPPVTKDIERRPSMASEPVKVPRVGIKEERPLSAIFNDTFRYLVEIVRGDPTESTASGHPYLPIAMFAAALTAGYLAAYTCMIVRRSEIFSKSSPAFSDTYERVEQRENSRNKPSSYPKRTLLPVAIRTRLPSSYPHIDVDQRGKATTDR